jgi:ceramide glucosyltransferase
LGIVTWQWVAARRFPLHQRVPQTGFAPGISLLKPLKGCDPATRACLESWLRQTYEGPVQVLFGVADPADPVCTLVRELIAEFPEADAKLVICAENLGFNAKVSTLRQLVDLARHGFLVVSDADVKAPSDLLPTLMAPFQAPRTGLVNCLYSLGRPATLAMRWEAVAINADFWSMVLQSNMIKPMSFALGAVMAIRRQALTEIGGFATVADHLADDYQLGNQLFRKGWSLELCPIVVECVEGAAGWQQAWRHQLRWARTIRFCQPTPYFFSLLSNGTLWPLILVIARPETPFLLLALLCWVVRMATALQQQFLLTRSRHHLFYDWLVLVKDLLQAVLWLQAFVGNTVTWRGIRHQVGKGGKLRLPV